MTPSQVAEFLKGADGKYRQVLQAAVNHEEAHASNAHYMGWAWFDVQAYPASLMKLVVAGMIKVSFKSNSSTLYLLVSRSATKQVLAGYRS